MINQKELFCENIRQCEKSMYALAYGIGKNEHDAADVIQEAILKAYCNYTGLRNSKKFKQWILQILSLLQQILLIGFLISSFISFLQYGYELSAHYSDLLSYLYHKKTAFFNRYSLILVPKYSITLISFR